MNQRDAKNLRIQCLKSAVKTYDRIPTQDCIANAIIETARKYEQFVMELYKDDEENPGPPPPPNSKIDPGIRVRS